MGLNASDAKLSAVLSHNRFSKLLDPWIDDGLYHFGDMIPNKVRWSVAASLPPPYWLELTCDVDIKLNG